MSSDSDRTERTYTIRQLCVEFKVTARALRFYEDRGLLSPGREGLNRIYGHRERTRLILILRGKRAGLSLTEIGELLDLYQHGDGGAVQQARILKRFRERIVALEAQREDIDQAIVELQQACGRLEELLAGERPREAAE